MIEIDPFYLNIFVWSWIGIAVATMASLFFITAPYGRHTSSGWGPMVSNRFGWILMELPALICVPLFFFLGGFDHGIAAYLMVAAWLLHYIHRTLIFPFRTRTTGKQMPLTIPLMGVFFNSINGFLIGYDLGFLSDGMYGVEYLYDPRFIIGVIIFGTGMWINWRSDKKLLNLRKPGETGYKIPMGGWFRWVSCPNYFGEIVEWTGFAIMAWSLPGVSFVLWTMANLLPRALANHKWYLNKFPEYPKERKAVIPYIL